MCSLLPVIALPFQSLAPNADWRKSDKAHPGTFSSNLFQGSGKRRIKGAKKIRNGAVGYIEAISSHDWRKLLVIMSTLIVLAANNSIAQMHSRSPLQIGVTKRC